MREIRSSGLEGGVALTRHPYPYRYRQFRDARSGERCSFCFLRMHRTSMLSYSYS